MNAVPLDRFAATLVVTVSFLTRAAIGAPAATPAAAPVSAVAAYAPGFALDAAPSAPALVPALAADTSTTEYTVGGVRVIHRQLAAHDVVAVNLYLLGGSAVLDSATAGIEAMLLRASEYGTAGFPGRDARLALGRTGSRIVIAPGPDWTLYGFRGLRADFDSTWAVFADRLMRPSLEPADVEIVRGRMLRALRNAGTHPDAIVRQLAAEKAFAGHPYANDPEGSEASLTGITPDALRAWHAREVTTSRLLLVVVGNVDRARVEAAVGRTLAGLPRGDYAWRSPPAWAPARTTVTAHGRRVPTNYVIGYFGGPTSDSRDYLPFRIATEILGGVAFSDIRTSGLSYAASAPFLDRAATGGGVYVTTTRPDSAVRIFNNTMTMLKDNVVSRSILQRYYRGFITEYYALNESASAQASFLARHQLLRGDWRLAGRYMEELRGVQGSDIRRVARNYMKNIQYAYVGNLETVPQRDMERH
jgi:zinc protease